MDLYIYNYNNYYNRIVKQESSLNDYGEPIHRLIDCKDFSPNDNVNTTHIFGSLTNNYDGTGDYLIVAQDNQILSRWFIIESRFNRHSQWQLTLRRDLVVDFYNEVIKSPCFIEKATLNLDDALIFNSENMTVNQIKTNESLLKDRTGCAWLVGYYDKTKSEEIKGTVPINNKDAIGVNTLLTPIENWQYYKYVNEEFYAEPTYLAWAFYGEGVKTSPKVDGFIGIQHPGIFTPGNVGEVNNNSTIQFQNSIAPGAYLALAVQKKGEALYNALANYVPYSNEEELSNFLNLNGKYIKDSTGRAFSVRIENKGIKLKSTKIQGGTLFNLLVDVVNEVPGISGQANGDSFLANSYCTAYNIVLTEETSLETKYDFSKSKLNTVDAPWNIFAIPFGEVDVKNSNGGLIATTNAEVGITCAMALQAQHPGIIYDIQLLPYFPIQSLITGDNEITLQNELQYSAITSPGIDGGEDKIEGIIFNVDKSRFDFNINYLIKKSESGILQKLNNECDKWRLSSPNYANYFDFSIEKNNGITNFNVDCEYKPFTPYIHLNPNFGNLYGKDYNDPRGLVCGGDFSLSQIINQWEQYQIQNKNYQLTFDRQIQNMEIQQGVARTKEIWGAIAGTAQGAVAGAAAGGMVGGPWGAVAGAAVGGISSAVGGILDYQMNELLRNEALDYTKDMFGYQLGNIQALPQTISKVSALNNNNKIFPVLEYYTCTEREKQAFLNKVAYNGMTVMAIGTIEEYLFNKWEYNGITSKGYIKGQLIRLEGLEDEYHLIKELSQEIFKGVYFNEYYPG